MLSLPKHDFGINETLFVRLRVTKVSQNLSIINEDNGASGRNRFRKKGVRAMPIKNNRMPNYSAGLNNASKGR